MSGAASHSSARPMTLLESAGHLGRCRYVELACFAHLGALSTRCEIPALASFFAGASLAHGWRADLLEAQLPVSQGLPGADFLTCSPGDQVEEALALWAQESDELTQLELTCGLWYPAMIAAYQERLERVSAPSDGAIARCCRRVVTDLGSVMDQGRECLASARRRSSAAPGPGPGSGPSELPFSGDLSRFQHISRLFDASGGPFGSLASPGQDS